MPAKKKRTKKEEIRVRKSAIAALNSLTMADTRPVLDELDRLRKDLAEANAALAAKTKDLEANDRAFAAIAGERTFLWEEIDRFRNRLMDYIGWEMKLPEDARVALNKVRAQEVEDALDEDAEES